MKKPLVSVIIPAYGHAHFIDETIDSALQQTYKNLELIIINDGSPDNIAEVIESRRSECEKRFTRFVFISRENKGLAKTLNQCLKEAQGEYVAITASDDKFEPEAIETLVSFLEKTLIMH